MTKRSPPVKLSRNDSEGTVDVAIDGKPFTSLRYDADADVLTKPVLYPLRTASGKCVTRGYPLDPEAEERVDHPHHIGHWFNYDPVNEVNFWANAGPVTDERWEPLGSIDIREITRMESGRGTGELAVTADWTGPDGPILRENTRFVFSGTANRRTVDRVTEITAVDRSVSFDDSKEGMFAVRVATELEHPEDETISVVDDPDAETTTDGDASAGRTGEYLSSTGIRGRDVWGTRAEWIRLAGQLGGDPVSVTIFDHPDNVGHPTYWMARGYGLFAANPLGQAAFSDGDERLGFELATGESVTFRYRIDIDDSVPSEEELDERAAAFASRYH